MKGAQIGGHFPERNGLPGGARPVFTGPFQFGYAKALKKPFIIRHLFAHG